MRQMPGTEPQYRLPLVSLHPDISTVFAVVLASPVTVDCRGDTRIDQSGYAVGQSATAVPAPRLSSNSASTPQIC